jgi:hypothetical protein
MGGGYRWFEKRSAWLGVAIAGGLVAILLAPRTAQARHESPFYCAPQLFASHQFR